MLVNCPKCGFSQPKDKYCASCGVDMEIFRPSKAPSWKRILTNPFIHVSFIFALVFISIVFIRQKQSEELVNRVTFLKGGPLIVEQQTTAETASAEVASEAQPETTETAALGSQAAPETAAPAEPTTVAAAAPPAVNANEASGRMEKMSLPNAAATPGAAKVVPKVSVMYLEVENEVLQSWMEEARLNNSLNRFEENVAWGTLANVEDKLKNKKGIKIFEQFNKSFEGQTGQAQWFKGTHKSEDPEQEIGLLSDLYASQSDDGTTHLDLEVQRSWRQVLNTPLRKRSFNVALDLIAGGAAFLSGLIPPKMSFTIEPDLNPDAFLQIYRSKAFQDRASEFTLLIKFDKVD